MLDGFSAAARAWFEATFPGPTRAQSEGWAAIGRGAHTLILAPTGSGKTLAAFLWTLDRLLSEPFPADPARRCRVVYVSPLKALSYDVERNLRAPLAGIGLESHREGREAPEIVIATRTGDTPQEDRRRLAAHPPDILITTPESLYLLLTSRAREALRGVEHVIVDEVHAVAGTKRGAHLALSLERLEQLSERPPQRIGLSATQRPLDELGRWLVGTDREVEIVDAGVRKALDLRIIVPVDDMGALGQPSGDGPASGAAPGEPEARASIWPAVYPRLLELIRAHRSTLVFVNSRRLAERLAARLNELAAEDTALGQGGAAAFAAGAAPELVRAHHGSIAREQRLQIEDALKAGRLPALVATSSLELGIDMGAVDLVVHVEAPTSVASGLQRIGRAGHHVGEPSRGRIFPKFRHDLLVAAVVARRMHAGQIEETRVPRNPLDVLAQQIVAMVAAEDRPVPVDEVASVVGRAYSFAELGRASLEGVLDMLSGRYPSDEFAELRPRLVWDRVAGTLVPRPGARMLAVTSGGTIPDRGLFTVSTPAGGRVGELDEEMVYESRVGETFLLGATTWRIEDITRDRVVVTPAPGVPGRMPFWHGDAAGRPYELGRAIGRFTAEVGGWADERLATECDLDELAVRNLREYLAEEREATGGLLPTDRQLVIERFRDELGDWRIAVLSPFGARVHAPWALAIEAKVRDRFGVAVQAVWSDDGIIVRLPEAEDAPAADVVIIDPDEVEDLVIGEVGRSALFAARFRECAARALLLPRRRPGSRTPLWQQRQRAADLLSVASRYGSFPILLETYRECLRDVFDLGGLVSVMADVRARRVRVASVDTAVPSPFASSLAFAYVAQFMYEGDAPLAERRAQALTLDRRMLAELVGSEELRDLLDGSALAQLEEELQCLDARHQTTSAGAAHDLLRRLGDLSDQELAQRVASGVDTAGLVRDRRAVRVRIAGEERVIAGEDAGRYRDGLGVMLPPGLPDAFLARVDDARLQLVRRWARTHGPFLAGEPARRFGLPVPDVEEVLYRLAEAGRLEHGEFRPDGTEREWCDVDVLRLLRQRSLAVLRRQVEPTEAAALARFLPAWQGVAVATTPVPADGADRLYEVIGQLEGFPLPASVIERDVLAARVRGYTPRHLDELLAAGEVLWVGAGALGRDDGRIVVALRDHAGILLPRLGFGPAGAAGGRPEGAVHDHLRSVLAARGACFFRELGATDLSDAVVLDALWDLVWSAEVTNDSFAAVRATVGSGGRRAPPRPTRPRGRRPGSLSALGPPRGQGRWTLVERELAGPRQMDATEASVAVAGLLLERHGVLTRDAVRGEGVPGSFAGLYPVLRAMEESGRVRRGYFVTGLGGAQFALPGAVDRLRSTREPATGSSGEAPGVVLLAATDPANAYGLVLPWPVKGPQRVAGAWVLLVDGTASLFVERGGRGLIALRDLDGEWEESAVGALADQVRSGRWSRLVVQRYPEALEAYLKSADFVPSPRGLVRYR